MQFRWASPWSAGTCHRFELASRKLYQSGDRSPHSKEASQYAKTTSFKLHHYSSRMRVKLYSAGR
jgi:hypothetical protein